MAASQKLSARENPIKAVTVYKSRKAEVVRNFSLDLKPGSNKIEITELPSCIDTHSVRVSGLSDARLFDVVCTTRDEPSTSSETVRLLKAKKSALESEKRVRDHESDLLFTYAKTLSGEHVSPTQMHEFLQSFVQQGRMNLEAVAELDEKIVALDRQIESEQQKQAAKKGASTGEVTVVLGTDSDARIDLKLTYIVSNASWESTYELHAATENGKPSSSVALHYRARIVQSTGEDWSDTALTLSTVAASTIAKSIPWLSPIKIRPQSHSAWKGVRPAAPGFANTSIFHQKNPFGDIPSVYSQPQVPGSTWNAGGLFGGGGGFGAFSQQQQPQQQHPQQHGNNNAFGNSSAYNQPQVLGSTWNAGGRGEFGAFSQQHPQQQPPQQHPQQQQQLQQQAPLFGTSQQSGSVQPQQNSSIFGAPQQNTSLFGAPQQSGGVQQQQQGTTSFVGLFGTATPAPSLPEASDEQEQAEDFEEIAIPGAQAGPTTIVTETPLAISYAVEGATTVPSDGMAHQVSVAVLPFEAKISHIVTPRVDARVYLQCHVKNTSEYRLLPGPVSVILDDSFVSTTSVNEINTGDTFTCTLGDDVAAKVTYARSSKTVTAQGGSFTEVFNNTTYNTKITIDNRHQFAINDLVVRDIIPTCDDKRAKVILRKPAGLAVAKDNETVSLTPRGLTVRWGKAAFGRSGEKDGRFEWAWSVEGGAKVVLEAEWELKAPADVAWVESVPLFG
ncbi:hypothetical protein B0H10DRAFT_2435257 [Mycena sp. CBHHK59/15]|nr:hypothetical protein B0H10DRAFT_2435257 [Mycena sp. CBHHK59/15]